MEASGVPREQAEVHAKAMTAMFLHNLDALVTKDYLNSRFKESEVRMEAVMDKRIVEVKSSTDKRFTDMESKMGNRFAELDLRLERMDGRFNLVYWMQGITIVCVVIPVIHSFLG